jgi:acetyltransferase-like isoleucine patch superfamily enzyme
MIKAILVFIRSLYNKVRQSLELRKYNRFTIAEYFRKQGAQIGEGCNIIPTFLATEPYLVKIGNHVGIAQGVKLITHDGGTWILRKENPNIQGFGPIIIEDNCIIGQNAILFPNIKIGPNSIVGAGSVVITDVPPNTIVMGIPARPFGSIEKYKEKCMNRWETQEPPDYKLDSGENWWNTKHAKENSVKLKKHLLKIFENQLRG